MLDEFTTYYQDYLVGNYDCVDRIVLNAYFPMGHNPGGFRAWWRQLFGSDDTLDNTHLIRIAGRFSRRLKAYAQAQPFVAQLAGWRRRRFAGVTGVSRGAGRAAHRAASE